MLRIERISDSDGTTFRLSGELRSAELREVRTEIEKVMPQITLDLIELSAVDLDGVRWLVRVRECRFQSREWRALHPRMDASGEIMSTESRMCGSIVPLCGCVQG